MRTRFSHYGWRARIGLIVPSVNLTMEPEFNRMAPNGVSVHSSRVLSEGPFTVNSYLAMAEETARAAKEIAGVEPDTVVYGCTFGSIVGGDARITERIQRFVGATPVVTTGTAVVEALRALGLRRIAVATPYVQLANDAEAEYLRERGFEVTRIRGLELGHDEDARRMMQRQPPGVAYRIAKEAYTPDADGIFISCTGFTAVPVIETLEEELGKPVVSSNQASFWAALRRAELGDRLQGYGALLREH